MKAEYTIPEVCTLIGLRRCPSGPAMRRLNDALRRCGWRRYKEGAKSSRFVWVPPTLLSDLPIPQMGEL